MQITPKQTLLDRWRTQQPANPSLEAGLRQKAEGTSTFGVRDIFYAGEKALDTFIDQASLVVGNGPAVMMPIGALTLLGGASLGALGAVAGGALGLGLVAKTAWDQLSGKPEAPTNQKDLLLSQADLAGAKLPASLTNTAKSFHPIGGPAQQYKFDFMVSQDGDQLLYDMDLGRVRAIFDGPDGKTVEVYCNRGAHTDCNFKDGRTHEIWANMKATTVQGEVYNLRTYSNRENTDVLTLSGPGIPSKRFRYQPV